MRAISLNICARNSSASAGVGSSAASRAGKASLPRSSTGWSSLRSRMPVVRRGRALLLEKLAGAHERRQITPPARRVLARSSSPSFARFAAEPCELRIDHRIRTEGRDHAPLPPGVADCRVRLETIERAVGRGNHLDVEAVVERARPKLFAASFSEIVSQYRSRCLLAEPDIEPEKFLKGIVKPQPRRCAAKEVIVRCEEPPHLLRFFGSAPSRSVSIAIPWL